MNFVKFTEHNDNEGESWNFWLQYEGNEAQLKELQSWLGTLDDDGEQYELDMTLVSEEEVDTLVKHAGGDYMSDQNKLTGVFTCPEFEDRGADSWEQLNDYFYKGDIERCFK